MALVAGDGAAQRAVVEVALVGADLEVAGVRRAAEGQGGAALVSLPWQALQASPGASRTPSMWCPPATSMLPSGRTVSGWHTAQALEAGWGGGGGLPWHAPQVDWLPSTCVQTGAGWAPPSSVAPWQ